MAQKGVTANEKKMFIVDLIIIAAFVALGCFCFVTGKAYDIMLENKNFVENGVTFEALEAVNVTIDAQEKPIYLLNGDMAAGNAVGLSHTLKIDVLDESDKAIPDKTKVIKFTIKQLGTKRLLQIPKIYKTGKI